MQEKTRGELNVANFVKGLYSIIILVTLNKTVLTHKLHISIFCNIVN